RRGGRGEEGQGRGEEGRRQEGRREEGRGQGQEGGREEGGGRRQEEGEGGGQGRRRPRRPRPARARAPAPRRALHLARVHEGQALLPVADAGRRGRRGRERHGSRGEPEELRLRLEEAEGDREGRPGLQDLGRRQVAPAADARRVVALRPRSEGEEAAED